MFLATPFRSEYHSVETNVCSLYMICFSFERRAKIQIEETKGKMKREGREVTKRREEEEEEENEENEDDDENHRIVVIYII